MATIENPSSPEVVATWFKKFESMSRGELLGQQLVQRGAENALVELQKLGVTAKNCQNMLDSLRHALMTLEEAAAKRGIILIGYDDPDEEAAPPI